MKKIYFLFCGIILVAHLSGQKTVSLTGQFNRFITYYISSIDINTGSSDIQLFSYLLQCDDCDEENNEYAPPVSINASFRISLKSPTLGIDEETTLALLETQVPFKIIAPMQFDNRDFTIETKELYDIRGNQVPVNIDIVEKLPDEDLNKMFSDIVQTGRLPDGIYRFELTIEAGVYDYDNDTWESYYDVVCPDCEFVVNVTTPTTLFLTSPGGSLEELEQNEVYTLYPVFQWESELFSAPLIENCERLGQDCGFYIRVAEFRCEDHATVEDAIEDLTVLPLDQTKGWELVGDDDGDGVWESNETAGNQLSFMYPTTGVVDLHPNGIYVWQIQKRISTTEGIDIIDSPIYAFQIKDLSMNPLMQAIQEILPEEVYESYFTPCGDLTGYTSSGVFKLDGIDSDVATLNALVEEFKQGTRSIITTEVR